MTGPRDPHRVTCPRGLAMNHVPAKSTVSDLSLTAARHGADSIVRAKTAIDEIIVDAYEHGDVDAVRTLHAVAALLAAVKH